MAVLASRTWGEAGRPPALLVHGITSSSRSWWTVGPALAERGFAVLAVDLRGHGASPRGSAGLGPAELAADVVETVAAWQGAGRDGAGPPGGRGGPAVDLLVGHSLGALVALALLAGHPGFARRVVLEDPPGPSFVDWDELDLAGMAATVGVPTLLLLAQEALGSNLVGPDRKALVDALPQVTARELPTGHSVHRESLAGWLGALDEWLAGPGRRPPA